MFDNGAAHVMPHIDEYSGGVLRQILILARLRGPARLQKDGLDESKRTVGNLGRKKRREKE